MMDELKSLRLQLEKVFGRGLRAPEAISDPSGMVSARRRVQQDHDSAEVGADAGSIMSAVEDFLVSGRIQGFRELKYVCLGLGTVDESGRCVLADAIRRANFFEIVSKESVPRRRLRCFQALLASYWIFPRNDQSTAPQARDGWKALRDWLRSERSALAKLPGSRPEWFSVLAQHVELLSEKPCDKFGEALLVGDSSGLSAAVEGLAIPKNSWVMEESVFAQMRAATALDDERFKERLPNLLSVSLGRGGFDLGESLQIRCVACLVARYARCVERPEHGGLRDAAVTVIGNPWLQQTRWDAWVVDSTGHPDHQARLMVNGWLKNRLIKDFFDLLSVEGAGDPRRREYWVRFEPFIEDMWFALGTSFQVRRGLGFDEFRKRAKGRLLDLADTTADNNAFLMRIGDYLAVEFGATGNAFYLLRWSSLGKGLMDALGNPGTHASVSIRELKPPHHLERLVHNDSSSETWEEKFDEKLVSRTGKRPASPPRKTLQSGTSQRGAAGNKDVKPTRDPARQGAPAGITPTDWIGFVVKHQLRVEDHRSKGGALWVLGEAFTSEVMSQLMSWGFKPRHPRGWFKE